MHRDVNFHGYLERRTESAVGNAENPFAGGVHGQQDIGSVALAVYDHRLRGKTTRDFPS